MTIGNLLSNILQFLNNLLEIINEPITICIQLHRRNSQRDWKRRSSYLIISFPLFIFSLSPCTVTVQQAAK